MDDKIEKLQQAKMYIDCLINGIDPIRNTRADADTLYNEHVLDCFKYISDVLAGYIYKEECRTKKRATDFFITDEQRANLTVFSYNCKVSEIANEINRVTAVNDTNKLSATWICAWLETEGYLCKSELRSRITTDKGKQLGIFTEYRELDNGRNYYINFYNGQAQRFVYDHIDDIVTLRKEPDLQADDELKLTVYPVETSVREFVNKNFDKCFIMAVGSCNSEVNVGSYMAALYYKGKGRVIKKEGIATNSANKCILTGILDASSAINRPTDVIILSSTALGFRSPKSINHGLCQEIYDLLTEKGCNVNFFVCEGKGNELNELIKSLG